MVPTHPVSATPAAKVSLPGPEITPVLTTADPKVSDPLSEPGVAAAQPFSEVIDHKATPTNQASDPPERDPKATHPDPNPSPVDETAATQASKNPAQIPNFGDQSQVASISGTDIANGPTIPQAPVDPVLTVGSATYQYHLDPSSNLVIASQTIPAGGPAKAVAGVSIGLAASAQSVMLNGSNVPLAMPAPAVTPHPPAITFGNHVITADSSSNYVIHSQTLVPGAPAITISNTLFSLPTSPSYLLVGSSTLPLQRDDLSAAPALTLGNQIITADSASNYVLGGQTIVPGGQAVTISGTPISLAPSAAHVVIGSSTIPLVDSEPSAPAAVVINDHTVTANSASEFVVAGQTITPGAPAVTISGTPVSIPINPQRSMTIGSHVYPIHADSSGNMLVASQTVVPGGSPVVMDGETISALPDGSGIVVASDGSTTTEGLGQIINGALGRTATSATDSEDASASATGLTVTGESSRQYGKHSFGCTLIAAFLTAFTCWL